MLIFEQSQPGRTASAQLLRDMPVRHRGDVKAAKDLDLSNRPHD